MTKTLIGIAISWAIASAAVSALEGWDLPGSNAASAHAVAADQISD